MAVPAATALAPSSPAGETPSSGGAAAQRASWRRWGALSSGLGRICGPIERFLSDAPFDRAPWLAVSFGCGIAAWFVLPTTGQWLMLMAAGLGLATLGLVGLRPAMAYPFCRLGLAGIGLTLAAGTAHVWNKSIQVGVPAIQRPFAGSLNGRVLSVEDRPARGEWRVVLVTRDPGRADRVIRVRLRVPVGMTDPAVRAGAVIWVKARLMPPAPPMLPGGHDFARSAWFEGIAATGTALGPVTVEQPGQPVGGLAPLRAALSEHIGAHLTGSRGGIAAALASGDRGGIAPTDEAALRDAGLSHLLSVSGLHVSAVVAASYWLVLRLLALWPWLALRLRLPLCAAAAAALAGVFYTLLTGAEVPTVRSMVGALLIMAAVALGREPLSLRLLAVAALAVMLVWPEAIMGPSFQLSFAAVLAIVALHGAGWMRRLVEPREEAWWATALRKAAGLLITGVVVEVALVPIGLFHFHRAGLIGALANVVAIPLTTFVIMPLVALALAFDLTGLGAPLWWLAGHALGLLLDLAHAAARVPGAVTLSPAFGGGTYALLLAGGLWLALWQGRVRLWGLVPIALGAAAVVLVRTPDLLVSADGRHVAVSGMMPGRLALLREPRPGFARDTLNEMAGLDGAPVALPDQPGVRCNEDFCALALPRGDRVWHLLLARGHDPAPMRDIVAACDRADLVIADRRLPTACRPRWLKADRALLDRTGGLALTLTAGRIETVRAPADDHGWVPQPTPRPPVGTSPPQQQKGPV